MHYQIVFLIILSILVNFLLVLKLLILLITFKLDLLRMIITVFKFTVELKKTL